jgi:hypothetical protein
MRRLASLVVLVGFAAWGQPTSDTPPIAPARKVIIVPLPPPEDEVPPAKATSTAMQSPDPAPAPIVVPLPREEPAAGEAPSADLQAPLDAPVNPDGTPLVPADDPNAMPPPPPPPPSGALLDGHLREGAFLSGPGSLTFVLHHTLMLGLGGLATQVAHNQGIRFDLSSREAMLAGTLIGAGLGFGFSAWWQFNHWIDLPTANFGIVNSVFGGMMFAGLVDLMTNDAAGIAWSAVGGAALGGWLTAGLSGGQLPMNKGLLITSGGGWAMAYTALLMAIIGVSSPTKNFAAAADGLLIAPGIGAGLMALASLKYNPTSAQILRADVFGAGVGGAVLLLSALVLGNFNIATPYVLALLSSAGAITAVSLLWEEAAERPQALYRDPAKDRPYSNVWW